MHPILDRLLGKRGIRPEELTEDEKSSFDKWQGILTQEVTVQTIADFCRNQIASIQHKWKDRSLAEHERSRLIEHHVVYSSLVALIESPNAEREALEKDLQMMLES